MEATTIGENLLSASAESPAPVYPDLYFRICRNGS